MSTTLDERVTRLERSQRLWRTVGALALALAVVSMAMLMAGSSTHPQLRVQTLNVVNASGDTVASLGADRDGAKLRIHSAETNADLIVGAFPGNIGIAIVGERHPRLHLAFGKKGFPTLSMADREGRTRLLTGLDADEHESPFLQMRDAKDRVRIYASVTDRPVIFLRDEAGRSTFTAQGPPSK